MRIGLDTLVFLFMYALMIKLKNLAVLSLFRGTCKLNDNPREIYFLFFLYIVVKNILLSYILYFKSRCRIKKLLWVTINKLITDNFLWIEF